MKSHRSMQSLRDDGFKIRVTHFRYVQGNDQLVPSREIREQSVKLKEFPGERLMVEPCGGRVEVRIETPPAVENDNKTVMVLGVSNCVRRDNFKRAIGTEMAFGRALKTWLAVGKCFGASKPPGARAVHKRTGVHGTVRGSTPHGDDIEYVMTFDDAPLTHVLVPGINLRFADD